MWPTTLQALRSSFPNRGTDFGWNQQGVDAARAVAEMHGLEFMPAEGLGYGDVRPTLRELAEDGASLMIAHASGYNTAAPEIAAETGVPVAIVDSPGCRPGGPGGGLHAATATKAPGSPAPWPR